MEDKIILQKMEETGLVPVVVIDNIEDAVPTAKALLQGGIGMMEITFRTSCAKDAIAMVKKKVPDMVVGAGTILDVKQAQDAVSAGAEFIVSPGFSEEVVRWCNDNKTAVVPGCVTPTEIIAARSLGLSVVWRDQGDQDAFRRVPRHAFPSDRRRQSREYLRVCFGKMHRRDRRQFRMHIEGYP